MPPANTLPRSEQRQAGVYLGTHVANHGDIISTIVSKAAYNYTDQKAETRGRARLQPFFVMDATHNGNMRADPLGCHPETCVEIIAEMIEWIQLRERVKNVLWIYGPAGIGKSAIAKTIAEKLDDKDSVAKLAASFFFWGTDQSRNHLLYFTLTLAYQLTIFSEALRKEVDTVLDVNPMLLHAGVGVQWKRLIVDTVTAVPHLPPAAIILDGLDECVCEGDQKAILELIASCGPNFPLAFVVASRPERHLVHAFQGPLATFCRDPINLSKSQNDREMEIFIKSRFAGIYNQHRDILQDYTSNGVWPAQSVVTEILKRADGQYIYPVTLFKYIDEEGIDPHERLEELLQQSGSLSQLDNLYTQIMRTSHSDTDNRMQDIMFLTSSGLDLNACAPGLKITALAKLAGLNFNKVLQDLRKLRSVLHVPGGAGAGAWVGCHHRSFTDFLCDSSRSLGYYIDKKTYAITTIERCLMVLNALDFEDKDVMPIVIVWWTCASVTATLP
ncbi:hypothetical protein AX16_008376 [Volvariella volvacea WC 439]|nr:hypothetical protein AX16_008376 [Volvariella volvacea WC 439]